MVPNLSTRTTVRDVCLVEDILRLAASQARCANTQVVQGKVQVGVTAAVLTQRGRVESVLVGFGGVSLPGSLNNISLQRWREPGKQCCSLVNHSQSNMNCHPKKQKENSRIYVMLLTARVLLYE